MYFAPDPEKKRIPPVPSPALRTKQLRSGSRNPRKRKPKNLRRLRKPRLRKPRLRTNSLRGLRKSVRGRPRRLWCRKSPTRVRTR